MMVLPSLHCKGSIGLKLEKLLSNGTAERAPREHTFATLLRYQDLIRRVTSCHIAVGHVPEKLESSGVLEVELSVLKLTRTIQTRPRRMHGSYAMVYQSWWP